MLGSVIRIGEAVCSEPGEEPFLGSRRKKVRSVIVNKASAFVPDVRRSPLPTIIGREKEAEIPSA
jgi:hypothetical protein